MSSTKMTSKHLTVHRAVTDDEKCKLSIYGCPLMPSPSGLDKPDQFTGHMKKAKPQLVAI